MDQSQRRFLQHINKYSTEFKIKGTEQTIKAMIERSSGSALWFLPPFIPKEDMVLINLETGDEYYLIGNPTSTPNKTGGTLYYKIHYMSQAEYLRTNRSNPTFNIGTINGNSIIGTQQHATINVGPSIEELKSLISTKPKEDKEQLEEMINLLKTIQDNNLSIGKGSFSKFADVLNKYSDIAIPLSSFLLKLFIDK